LKLDAKNQKTSTPKNLIAKNQQFQINKKIQSNKKNLNKKIQSNKKTKCRQACFTTNSCLSKPPS